MKSLHAINWRGLVTEALIILALTTALAVVGVVVNQARTVFVGSHAVVPEMTAADLNRYADVIVSGEVVRQSQRAVGNARTPRVLTDNVLRITDRYRGMTAPEIVVTAEGGRAGNVVEVVEDQVSFAIGDRVIAFLLSRPDGTYVTVGLWQGRYLIRGDVATNGKDSIPVAELLSAISHGR